jgi:colicin import membrane protein
MRPFLFRCCVFFLLLGLIGPIDAQTTAEGSDAERQRIVAERNRLQADLIAEDAACYKKFFVNSCLGEVDERRRAALSQLRRREVAINDQERKIRGEEQIRKTEEKASAQSRQDTASRQDAALADEKARLAREREKQNARAARPAREQANEAARAGRMQKSQEKSADRSARTAAEVRATQEFGDRQKKAQDRRAEHEAEQRKQSKPAAKPLPTPQ